MKLETLKTHFFEEALELGLATETELLTLETWLEENGYDPDVARMIWDNAREELAYLQAEAIAEFS